MPPTELQVKIIAFINKTANCNAVNSWPHLHIVNNKIEHIVQG